MAKILTQAQRTELGGLYRQWKQFDHGLAARGPGQWRGRPAEVTVQNFPAEHQQGPGTRAEPDPLITLYWLSRLSMIEVQPVVRGSGEHRATLHAILGVAPMPRGIVKTKSLW